MPDNKINQSTLNDFIATVKEKPSLSDVEAFKYFPEFNNDKSLLDAAWSYKSTVDSKKYKNLNEINSKFPEFFPSAPSVEPKKEESIIDKTIDLIKSPFVGTFDYFFPDTASTKDVESIIKSEQAQERSAQPKAPDLGKALEKDKVLFESFKRNVAFDFQKQGIKYDDALLNQEAVKRLNDLGYNQEPFSPENPTLVFKQNAPKLNLQQIDALRSKAAQDYASKINELESEIGSIPNFLGEGFFWDISKLVMPEGAVTEIENERKILKKLEEEKTEIDEQYKAAKSFQDNKYTTSENGVMSGFISTQIDPKDALADPDGAYSVIQNSYQKLFSDDQITNAKSSPEAKQAYKKALIEKSVFLNNEFNENALVELKAMEEGKVNTDVLVEKLGLDFLQTEGEKERLVRGYSSVDEQYHLSQQIKREKEPIIQSINQDKAYKDMYDQAMKDYLDNKKIGKTISIDGKPLDETWFKSAMKTSSALEQSIKKKQDDLAYLESVEVNDTKEFKQHQENQKILNETGDKTRIITSLLESGKKLLRTGEKINDVLYLTLGVDDDEIVDFRGQKLKRGDIESAKIYKPLRRIDQGYELISTIGESTERIKSTEAEAVRIFDDKGNFSPDVDLAALAGVSLDVAVTSRILGGAAVAEELTTGAFLKGLLKPSELTLKELGKTGVRNLGSEFAKRGVIKGSNIALGYVAPTNLLLGSESIGRYIKKGYNFDQAFSLSIIDNTIEGLTEVISPNDALIVKNMILKGEIKTAKELAENEVYKEAFKKTYKVWTGKTLSDKLYNTIKAYSPSVKHATKVLLEETGEEIAGEGARSLAYKSGLSQKNAILDEPGNFTATNIANIAVSTMATMLWTGKQAFSQDLQQRDIAQSQYRYTVGKNVAPYVNATLDLLSKDEITDEEAKRRLKAITEFEDVYNFSNLFAEASKGYSDLNENEKETLKQRTFLNVSRKTELEKAILEAPTDEEKGRLIELLDKTNNEINDLRLGLYKTDEDRIKSRTDSTNYFINENSVKSFSNIKQIDNLIAKYEAYKGKEKDKTLIDTYNNAIKLLQNRKAEVLKLEEEDLKTEDEKTADSINKGVIKIKDTKGVEKELQIGKKYIVGRQIVFGKANPVRFPEVTFLGYKLNENNEVIKDENGSPIVIVETVNTRGDKITVERPISAFEDYNLGTEEALKATSAGRFYNKFKSKKFVLSFKDAKGVPNWIYNNLVKQAKQDLEGVGEVEGYLSAETEKGKPVIYFNFINPKTGKEVYYKLSDKMIDYTQKKGGYLKPKQKTFVTPKGQTIIKTNQYEDLTPEEMEEMGFFTAEELEQYKKYVETEDFSDLKNQRLAQEKRRRDYLKQYIEKISAKLTKTLESISKINSSLPENKALIESLNNLKSYLNIVKVQNIKIDELEKVLPKTKVNQFKKLTSPYDKVNFLRKEINSKIESVSKKIESDSKKLQELEEEKAAIQPAIDQEIAFLEEIDIEEFDYSESLVPQLKQKREALKEALKENNRLIDEARGDITSFEKVIASLKEAIEKLFNSIERFIDPEGFIKTTDELRKNITEANSSINSLNGTIFELESKSKKLEKDIKSYNRLISNFQKLEAEYNKITSGFLKDKIKEFLFAQQAPADENATGDNTQDKAAAREEDSARKYFEDLFLSSISFGFKYEQELKDPNNNYANARLDFFFNNFRGEFKDFVLIPINKKNAEKFGLTGILYEPEIDTDVKLVVAKKTTDGYMFLDMNGNPIKADKDGKVFPDQVVYTSLQKASLTDSEGKLKYNLKNFEGLKESFPNEAARKAEIERIANEELQKYAKFRQGIVDSDNPPVFVINDISRGIPQYNEKGDTIARNAVRGNLAPANTTSFKGKIQIADKANTSGSKLGNLTFKGKNINMPLGRPVYVDAKNNIFQFLDNNRFSQKQKEVLVAVLKQMASDIIENYNKKKTDPTVQVVPTKYVKFLEGVVYWRNPSKNINNAPQDPATIKPNQMWLDFTDGEAMLMIGTDNKIPLKDLITGDILIESLVETLYHNTNMKVFGKSFTEYYLEGNKLKERIWKSYEDYLLSDKYPDGTTRGESEIPLTTSVIPNDSPFDENGKFKENYNPQYRSRYFIFLAPGLERPKINKVKKVVQETQTPAPAKTSKKSADVIKSVDEQIEDILNNTNENLKLLKQKTFNTWKSLAANLKENTVYTYSLTSERLIKINNNNADLFTFTVKFDKDGNIKVDIFNVSLEEDFKVAASKILPSFELKKEGLEAALNFFGYNSSDLSKLGSFTLIDSFTISEVPTVVQKTAPVTKPAPEKQLEEFISATEAFGIKSTEKTEKETPVDLDDVADDDDVDDKGGYRIAKGEAKVKENIEKARQWVKERFSNVDFSVVQGLVDGIAWGKFVKNGIILSEAAEIGTVYHEAFEAVAAMFLNKRQWNELVREFKSRKGSYIDRETGKLVRFSEATENQIKEQLAEEYRDYEMSGGKTTIPGQYKTNSLFRRIWNAIKALIFGDPKNIEDLFKKISAGEFKDKAPVKWNRPFNLEKSYRIANLQDDLFYSQLNKSLSLYALRNMFSKTNSFSSIFKLDKKQYVQMFQEVKDQLNKDYFFVKNKSGEYVKITDFTRFNTVDEALDNYDEFFDTLLKFRPKGQKAKSLPLVIKRIFATVEEENLTDEQYVAKVKNKVKDALLAYAYINDNWEQIVNKNKDYIEKFKISYEGDIIIEDAQTNEDDEATEEDTEDSASLTEQEKKESVGRDEYTKDPFSVSLKDRANSKIKLLIATLPVSVNVRNAQGQVVTVEKLNDLGLPEIADFSKTFRKVVSTVIEQPTLLEQLKALKEASLMHPELAVLYNRLGGDKTVQEISEDPDLWNLRLNFNQTFNKQRFGFSRLLMKEEEKKVEDKKIITILSNLIDSLQSSSYKAIEKRFITQFKEVALKNPQWLDVSTYNIPATVFPQETFRNPADYIPYLESIGFNIPYDVDSLSKEDKEDLFTAINAIATFIKGGTAKLEKLKNFNFSKHVAELARIEYKVAKDAGEVQHKNIEGMSQSNDISQNSLSIVFKALNLAKDITTFQLDLPRFNDVFTQNAIWRSLYFEDDGKRNNTKIRVESAEGIIETNSRGKHTSKLNYGQRLLQEFIYNIVGDSKKFRSPGFYVITPADIKTEEVIKWGNVLVENNYIESETGVFDNFLKGYLIDEINLARELSQDDRGLKEYKKVISTPGGDRTIAKSLRMFNDILKFDYTDIIDNPDLDINDWIQENREEILKNVNEYFDTEVEDTFQLFKEEGIITLNSKTKMYDLLGMETQMLPYLDSLFGTELQKSFEKTGEVSISEENMKAIIKYRAVNYFVNINEQSKLFFGDFGQFGDLTKRIKSFVSSRETTAFDNYSTNGEVYTKPAKALMNKIKYVDELGNVEEVEISEEVPGYQSFESTFKASTIQDVETVERSLPYIQEVHQESLANDIFFSDFKSLPEKVRKEISKLVSRFVEPFTKVNEADGQAYMALPLYRQFLHRSSMWNDDLQELYDYHMAYERNKRNQYGKYTNGDAIKEIDRKILEKGNPNEKRILEGKEPLSYPVIKPIGAGVRPGNKFITTLDKCSVAPLHYKLLEGKPSLEMYLSAIDQDVQYFRFQSAHKVGTPAEMQKAYNNEGKPNTILQTDELSFQDYAIQVETRTFKDAITRGTQLLKLAFINLMEASIPVDFIKQTQSEFQDRINELKESITEDFNYDDYISKWKELRDEITSEAKKQWEILTNEEKRAKSPIFEAVDDHDKVLSALTNRYFNNISQEFSIVKNQDGTYKISDYSKFKEAIVKQLKDRNAAENLLRQLEIENGKFVQPFDFIIGADKLEPILMAIINNNVTQPKVKGKSLAQIASTFFEDKARSWVKKTKNEDGTFTYEKVENPESTEGLYLTSNNLIFYGDEIVEENGIPRLATEKEIKEGKSKKADFMEIMLPPIFKDAQGNFITDINKIDPELLKIPAYRIPAQELAAAENIRIKGFLPVEYQNGVVVPSSITAKAGSDFDIDKLNMYLYHYVFSAKQNKVVKINYLTESNSTTEDRYVEFVKSFLKKNRDVLENDEISDSLKEEAIKEMKKNFTKIVKEKFKNAPAFTEQKEAFSKAINLIKNYKDKKAGKSLLDILYSKEAMFDKYQTITAKIEEEKTKQLVSEGQVELNNIQLVIDELFMVDEAGKNLLEVLKEVSKKTVGYALLKGSMKEKQFEVLANYVYLYNVSLEGLPVFNEFKDLPIDEQNTKEALENRYIDILLRLLSFEENKNRMLTPNSAATLQALAERMDELKKDVKKTKLGGNKQNQKFGKFGSALNNAYTRRSFQVGKEGVGIGAVGVTNHAVNQFVDSAILNEDVKEIELYFPTNKESGKASISFKRDASGNWISNNISEIINGFVDIAKDPFIIKINGNLSTAGAYLIANKMGIPLENVAMIMNQPIVEYYEELKEKGTSSIWKTKLKKAGLDSFTYPLKAVALKYGTISDSYEPKMFTITELEDMIRNQDNLTEKQKQDQLKIFELYQTIQGLSDGLRQAVNTYNFDTDSQKSITGVYSKLKSIASYQKDPSIYIYTEGKFFSTIRDAVVNYTSSIQSLFKVFTDKYRKHVIPIIEDLSFITDKNTRELALMDVKRGFANYLLLTIPTVPQPGINSKDLVSGNNTLQSKLKELMLDNESSVTTRLKKLQDKMQEGKIPTNFALQELFRLVKDADKKTNNLTVFNRSKDPEYIDLMVNSLKELEQSTDPEVSKLAQDIYTLALLQSGLNQSFVSISQYIPDSWFTPLAKTMMNTLDEMDPKVLDDHLKKFKSYYYANKWKDPKFTSKVNYRFDNPEFSKQISTGSTITSFAPAVEVDALGKFKVNNSQLAKYQLVKYLRDINGKYTPAVFQRVEYDNGDPILIQTQKGYSFLYRRVTPLGDGQYALEFTPASQINENIEQDTNANIIAKLAESTIQHTSLSELLEQEKPTKVTPTAPVVTPTVAPKIEVISENYSSELLKANPNKLFLFGDNNQRTGKGGQAIIRDEPNAMGISTKLLPKNTPEAFMSDNQLVENKAVIDSDIKKAKERAAKEGMTIVLPKGGFGTGLAALATKAPQTFAYLNQRLQEEFGFNNTSGEITPTVTTEVKGENVFSKGSEFAKKLTNPGNDLVVEYKGKTFRNAEHAYQTWKSGEFDQAAFESKAFKPVGKKAANKATNYQTMVEILTAKLQQHPELIEGINERGGLAYIQQSTHNVTGDKFWESAGQNKFIQALAEAYQLTQQNPNYDPNNEPNCPF